MGVDVRALFDELQIPYRDRGRNVGRGNLVIECPWCGDDPSMHLSVNLSTGAYYCWRDPRHCGGEPLAILRRLRIAGAKAEGALAAHRTAGAAPARQKQARRSSFAWESLRPALEAKHLRYLAARGFGDPLAAVRLGDLRYAESGEAKWRLLFPLWDGAQIRGWTGRAMHEGMTPKYQTECDDASLCVAGNVYAPTLLAVEGPFDALKANYAIAEGGLAGISAFAFLGKKLSQGRVELLMQAAPERVLICVDNDAVSYAYNVSVRSHNTVTFNDLRLFTHLEYVRLPENVKDVGEMTSEQALHWIKGVLM